MKYIILYYINRHVTYKSGEMSLNSARGDCKLLGLGDKT